MQASSNRLQKGPYVFPDGWCRCLLWPWPGPVAILEPELEKMYIYNVTTNIEASVHDEWLRWMKEIHIPDVMATGKFLSAKMCKVLVEEDMGGITYSVQFKTVDRASLQKYYKEDAPGLREDALRLFPGKFVSFRTELEIVSEH